MAQKRLLGLVAVVAIIAAACGGSTATSAPGSQEPGTSGPPASAGAAPTANTGDLAEEQPEGMSEFMMRLGAESLDVVKALGKPVVPLFGLKDEDIQGSNQMLQKFIDKLNHDIGPGRGANTTLQDHMKGRLSEIDLINGYVAEEGRKRGIPTPANETMIEMTRRIHAGVLKPDPSNLPIALQLLRSKI